MPAVTDKSPALGIFLMAGFCVFGPSIDMFAKLAGETVPLIQITAARFMVQLALLLPLALWLKCLHRPRRKEMVQHLMRGALILLATSFFFAAVQYLPLADAISIFFIEPFILTLLGALFLSEPIGWRRILACIIGFGGALLVIQPQYAQVGWAALLPIGTAICFALYLILTRQMSTSHPVTLQIYSSVAASLYLLPVILFMQSQNIPEIEVIWPDIYQAGLLLGVGASATIAHMFLTSAFRYASVGLLAPLQYLEIVTATLLGVLIFGDVPDSLTFVGISIIIGAGLYVFFRERKLASQSGSQKKKQPSSPSTEIET